VNVGDLSRKDLALLSIRFLSLINVIAEMLDVDVEALKEAALVAQRDVVEASILLGILDVDVSEEDLSKALEDSSEMKNIVKKFYRRNMEVCHKNLDFMAYMINNKLIELDKLDRDLLRKVIRAKKTKLSQETKVSIFNVLLREEEDARNMKTAEIKVLTSLINEGVLGIDDIKLKFLDSLVTHFGSYLSNVIKLKIVSKIIEKDCSRIADFMEKDPDLITTLLNGRHVDLKKLDDKTLLSLSLLWWKFNQETRIELISEIAKRNPKTIKEITDEVISALETLDDYTILKLRSFFFDTAYKILYERYGDRMWTKLVKMIDEETAPMIAVILFFASKSISKVMAITLFKKYAEYFSDPYKQFLLYFSGNISLSDLYAKTAEKDPDLTIKIAIITKTIDKLPNELLNVVIVRYPSVVLRSEIFPVSARIRSAILLLDKGDETAINFIRKQLNKNPDEMKPFLFEIFSKSFTLLNEYVSYGSYITVNALYALAVHAQRNNWSRNEIIKFLSDKKQTIPADVDTLIKITKKKGYRYALQEVFSFELNIKNLEDLTQNKGKIAISLTEKSLRELIEKFQENRITKKIRLLLKDISRGHKKDNKMFTKVEKKAKSWQDVKQKGINKWRKEGKEILEKLRKIAEEFKD